MEPANKQKSKRQRTAELHDLAEEATRNPSRQRLGVRLSSAAFVATGRACSIALGKKDGMFSPHLLQGC